MNPAWYVSVQDAGRTALVMGPFDTEAGCRLWAYRDPADGGSHLHSVLVDAVCKVEPKAWFYAWGMVKITDWTALARFCDADGVAAA